MLQDDVWIKDVIPSKQISKRYISSSTILYETLELIQTDFRYFHQVINWLVIKWKTFLLLIKILLSTEKSNGPSAISIEEARLLKSLERLNNRLCGKQASDSYFQLFSFYCQMRFIWPDHEKAPVP